MQLEQKVIWIFHSDDKKLMETTPSGERTIFSKKLIEESYLYDFFSLYDVVNDIFYSIDLSNGDFVINGVSVEPCKELNGRMMSFYNNKLDYRAGLIQYKESMPVRIGMNDPVVPKNFNIGWKMDFSEDNYSYRAGSTLTNKIMNVKCILSVDSSTLKPRFSISITEKRKFDDGREEIVKV